MRRILSLFSAALVAACLGSSSATAAILYDNTFTSTAGGMSVNNAGPLESAWSWDGSDTWRVEGTENQGTPSSSGLRSPTVIVTGAGPVDLSFTHRYSFEFDGVRWDGGQVRVSVNGGAYQAVPNANFLSGGYDGAIEGNNALTGQLGYNGDSPDYGIGSSITSQATLGSYPAGTTLSVEFLGAWDEFSRGNPPNWQITSLRIADSANIPEPSTMALLAVAGASLAIARRRARR